VAALAAALVALPRLRGLTIDTLDGERRDVPAARLLASLMDATSSAAPMAALTELGLDGC
jgi:hypothetical protein